MTPFEARRRFLVMGGLLCAGGVAEAALPLRTNATRLSLMLEARGGRRIAVTGWRPPSPRGTVLFSHGAASSPDHYAALLLPWVARGYAVWAPLHVDSAQHSLRGAYSGLKSWAARIEDMAVLANHLDETSFVAVGHSYGALVALTLGGAAAVPPAGHAGPLADRRVAAAVAFSPPGLIPGLIEAGGYADVAVPLLVQTGTRDVVPARNGAPVDPESWRQHLTAFDEARAGGSSYGLILDGVDHYFGGKICDFAKPGPPQSDQLRRACAIATLFADAWGLGEHAARDRLDRRLGDRGPIRLLRK